MFFNATSFDQNLAGWGRNLASLENAASVFDVRCSNPDTAAAEPQQTHTEVLSDKVLFGLSSDLLSANIRIWLGSRCTAPAVQRRWALRIRLQGTALSDCNKRAIYDAWPRTAKLATQWATVCSACGPRTGAAVAV